MKKLVSILIVVLSAVNLCLAQIDSTFLLPEITFSDSIISQKTISLDEIIGSPTMSTSWIPLEMKGETLFIEKYSEISTIESMDIISATSITRDQDEYLKTIYSYNLVFRRKINNEIQTVFDNSKLENIAALSTRDIKENLDDNIRFVLKAEFNATELVTGQKYSPKYYIYDQKNNIRYRSFWGLEAILKSLKSYNWYANNRVTSETTQSTIDDYVARNMPDEPRQRRRMSRGTKIGIVAILGYAALFIINAITE